MFNSRQSKFFHAVRYMSLLTVCSTGAVQAMQEEDNNNRKLIKTGHAGTKNKVTVTPQRITISNVNREQFSELMSDLCLTKGLQSEDSYQNAQIPISLDPNKNSFYVKGQAVLDILNSLQWKNAQGNDRYASGKTRQFNTALTQDMTPANSDFSNLLKQKTFSPEAVRHLSELTYGMQKLEENYFTSMVRTLEEEKIVIRHNRSKEDGYASEYINQKNRTARQRFVNDSLDIFEIRSENSEIITGQMAKSRFNNFHSFIKIYLGLVRDTTGGLYARDMALELTSANPKDNGLSEDDMNDRRRVISLHYLGSTERTFQILDELKPLADIAYAVAPKFFSRELIEDQLNFARNALNEFFLKELE